MLQGIVLLAMAIGTAGMGAYALGNTEEVCRRRADVQGRPTTGRPSEADMRRVRWIGIASVVMGVVAGIVAIVLMTKMSALQHDIRELEDQQDQPGAPTTF